MRDTNRKATTLLLVSLLTASIASAQGRPSDPAGARRGLDPSPAVEPRETPPPASPEPAPAAAPAVLVHAPPAAGQLAGFGFKLVAEFRGQWTGTGIEARYRVQGARDYRTAPFLRDAAGNYIALIPPDDVVPPAIEYFIETTEADGTRKARFATTEQPYRLAVTSTEGESASATRLSRHGGRRSMVSAGMTYSSYGTEKRTYDNKDYRFKEHYNLVEASYTYRFLLDQIHSISFGFGLLGGKVGALTPDRSMYDVPEINSAHKPSERPPLPGVYYGSGTAYWEVADVIGIEPRVILGASHMGFEGGGGLLVRIGTVTRTHFDVAFEGISHVGWKLVTEFAWDTVPFFMLSLRNEITTYPFNGKRASVPSINVTGRLPWGIETRLSVGYGARKKNEKGGLCLGGGVNVSF